MKRYKYLTQPNKYPKKFIKELLSCVKKKRFMTIGQTIRNKKIIKLIREFNEMAVGELNKVQIEVMGAIFQGCILIDDYNELFFKDIKIKFIDHDEYMEMRLKYPYAKMQLEYLKGKKKK